MTTQPGPGPKPSAPTGPTPTGPGPQRGDLSIIYGGVNADPIHLPALAEIVRKATMGATWLLDLLGRQWDPTTGPSGQDDPWAPDFVDVHFGNAVTDIRSALIELAEVAAMIPARQDTTSASLPGGPPNHPDHIQGEGLTPGLAGARLVARADGSDTTPPGREAGESSAPRPGRAEGARPAQDAADPPGGGFTPPGTRPFVMYSSVVNAAFARQHRMGRRP